MPRFGLRRAKHRVHDPAAALGFDWLQFVCGAIVVGFNDVQPIGHINGIVALALHERNHAYRSRSNTLMTSATSW